MTLEEYRIKRNWSYAALARFLGELHESVRKWCQGRHTPSMKRMVKIQQLTGNKVRLDDWARTATVSTDRRDLADI